MDVKIDFDPAQIAEKLHEAIISGTFKEIFIKAVEEEIKRLTEKTWSTDSIVSGIVQGYIQQVMRDMLNKDFRAQIEEVIREKLDKERIGKLCDELVEKIKVDRY